MSDEAMFDQADDGCCTPSFDATDYEVAGAYEGAVDNAASVAYDPQVAYDPSVDIYLGGYENDHVIVAAADAPDPGAAVGFSSAVSSASSFIDPVAVDAPAYIDPAGQMPVAAAPYVTLENPIIGYVPPPEGAGYVTPPDEELQSRWAGMTDAQAIAELKGISVEEAEAVLASGQTGNMPPYVPGAEALAIEVANQAAMTGAMNLPEGLQPNGIDYIAHIDPRQRRH